MVLVSGCLLGINCKYNGFNSELEKVIEKLNKYGIIPVCPEQLGGLSTPRNPAEIIGGSGKTVLEGNAVVKDCKGVDVTDEFLKGAEETLKLAKKFNVNVALLKSRSPSCGLSNIYDGTFSGKKIEGNGVTTQILKDNNIEVFTEENFEEMLSYLQANVK